MAQLSPLSIRVLADAKRRELRGRHSNNPVFLGILEDLSDEELVAKYHEHEAMKIWQARGESA